MKGKIAGSTLLCVNSDYESIMFSIIGVSNDAKEHLCVKRIFELFIFLFYLVQILVNVENLEGCPVGLVRSSDLLTR
jgi:hypothetical protein